MPSRREAVGVFAGAELTWLQRLVPRQKVVSRQLQDVDAPRLGIDTHARVSGNQRDRVPCYLGLGTRSDPGSPGPG